MKPDDFLDPVTYALIFPPKESIRLIGEVYAGAPPSFVAEPYVDAALGDVSAILRAAYRPSASTFVAIRHENEPFDVIRALWVTQDGARIHMAQTQFVIAVWVEGLEDRIVTAADVKKVAYRFLDISPEYTFELWGRAESQSFGGYNPENSGWEDADWPHWRDELRWWSGEGRLAFITLKSSGGSTRQAISFDPEDNVAWF